LKNIISLARIEHWIKNLFIFIPPFFAARLFETVIFERAILAFLAFSMVASGVYILNDLVDAPQDKLHPTKKLRPIASNVISRSQARIWMGLFLAIGFSVSAFLGYKVLIITALYFTQNILYSFWLKHIAIIDISLIGLGFLLRVFAGGVSTGTAVSNWLIVLTFLLALIMGLAKRRGEYLVETGGHSFRRSLEGYNLAFIDVAMVVSATVTIVAYLMYCFSEEVIQRIGSDRVFFTVFFVIIGILRYLQLTLVFNKTESPTRVLWTDRFTQIVLLCWVLCFVWLLYLKKLAIVG
jgi:decaprenyl-phosphate phosphoribosyltransferase